MKPKASSEEVIKANKNIIHKLGSNKWQDNNHFIMPHYKPAVK